MYNVLQLKVRNCSITCISHTWQNWCLLEHWIEKAGNCLDVWIVQTKCN